jgi:hypothetical protein
MKTIQISMTLLALLLAVACHSTGPQGPSEVDLNEQALTTVYRYKWNGASASGSAYGANSSLYFDVSENKSGKTRGANLSFYGWGYDPASEVCQTDHYCYMDYDGQEYCYDYQYCYFADYFYTYGWGPIPNKSFRINGNAKGATLSVDLANAPGFSAVRCQYYDWTCTPITSGSFDVTWASNGAYSYSQNGTSTSTWGSYTQRSVGQSSSASADVRGTVLGMNASGWGSLSMSKGNGVSRDISGGGSGGTGGSGGMSGFGGMGGMGGVGGVGGGVDAGM